MKNEQPSRAYVAQAKLLSKEDAERLFARMRRRYLRAMKEGGLTPLDAVALQLEHEDAQLKDWRDKIAKLRARSK